MSSHPPPVFAGMALLLGDGSTRSGAAFELQGPAHESEVVEFDGWEAEVREGERIVVVRGGPGGNYKEALAEGLSTAQRALDLMSMRAGNNLVIKAFDDEHLVWWSTADGLAVRIVSLAPLRIDVPPVTLTITDAAGNVVPTAPTPPVAWHESYRYFRLSQTTDDLFDAYRNAYLALESVLSSIAPQHTNAAGKVTEREGDWFKSALTAADTIVPLAPFAPAATVDPVQDLFDDLYVSMRSAMSHAKSGRRILLPQDETERAAVTTSLRRLVSLYLTLAEAHLGARRLGGGMSAVAFRMMATPTLERMEVYVSDDDSPFDKAATSPNPAGGAMRAVGVGGAVDTSEPFIARRLWAAPGADLSELPCVRRVVGMIDGHIGIVAVLEGALKVGSAARLEVMLGARGSNRRQPRERYSY